MLAFRGTTNIATWATNLNLIAKDVDDHHIHRGFYNMAEAAAKQIRPYMGRFQRAAHYQIIYDSSPGFSPSFFTKLLLPCATAKFFHGFGTKNEDARASN